MTEVILNTPRLWLDKFPWPQANTHKHKRGALGVVSGRMSSTGAARLAAKAGLRVGAGLVTLFSPPSAVLVNASHVTAIMVKAFQDTDALGALCSKAKCTIIGPGAGLTDQTLDNVLQVLEASSRAVLDADALTVFERRPSGLFGRLRPNDILTPHEGEFERLFPGILARYGREQAALEASNKAGSVILLKGPQSLVAAPDGRICKQESAPAWLATAGSGDTLAGLLGGLMAQGMDTFLAACAGVWIHAEAGRLFGPGLTADDLEAVIPEVLRSLYDLSQT